MNHWIIVPVVLPALVAPFIVAAARYDLVLQRVFGIAAAVACSRSPSASTCWPPTACRPALRAGRLAGAVRHRPGARPAVGADAPAHRASWRWSSSIYAAQGWDRRGRHFHALFQFQLMGLNGAFLTGDVFNLFVFFEVLLIASYGLMLHGAGARRITEGLKYVAINLAGSTLFLFAVGLIYALTGTLNMADLAVKVPLVPASDQALLRLGGALLLVVFAIKGALVPLHLWLPGTYGAASPPVAALFAIMTKVGAYAILRVYVLIFGGDAGAAAWLAEPYVLPAAALTLALGMIGVLASRTLTALAVYALLGSVGTLLLAVGLFDETATAAALYYLVHSTLAGAALFLLADLVARRRGGAGDRLVAAPPFAQLDLLAGLFFLAAIAAVGLPPLSGFVGKLLILEALAGPAGLGPGSGSWSWSAACWRWSASRAPAASCSGSARRTRGEREPDRPSNDTAGLCAAAAAGRGAGAAGPVRRARP